MQFPLPYTVTRTETPTIMLVELIESFQHNERHFVFKMNPKQLEEFYRKWLEVNHPKTKASVAPPEAPPLAQHPETLENIIFQNDIFELFIEKGMKNNNLLVQRSYFNFKT